MEDAVAAHQRALTLGGLQGIPNPEMIESALARPYSGYYRRIEQKAAALAQAMASNHGFADGNKRTTVILIHTLLAKSGYVLRPAGRRESLDRATESLVLGIVNHEISQGEVVEWFRRRIRRA
jgi:death-on-curing protein